MPEQKQEKRCGTCEHWERKQCFLTLPPWLAMTITMPVDLLAHEHESCSFWTPKPEKRSENKEE